MWYNLAVDDDDDYNIKRALSVYAPGRINYVKLKFGISVNTPVWFIISAHGEWQAVAEVDKGVKLEQWPIVRNFHKRNNKRLDLDHSPPTTPPTKQKKNVYRFWFRVHDYVHVSGNAIGR